MKNKTTRHLKVYENGNREPYITIKAKWLKDCGFIPHSTYELKVDDKRLILEVIKEPEVKK
jgi:hypothetical protein